MTHSHQPRWIRTEDLDSIHAHRRISSCLAGCCGGCIQACSSVVASKTILVSKFNNWLSILLSIMLISLSNQSLRSSSSRERAHVCRSSSIASIQANTSSQIRTPRSVHSISRDPPISLLRLAEWVVYPVSLSEGQQ